MIKSFFYKFFNIKLNKIIVIKLKGNLFFSKS